MPATQTKFTGRAYNHQHFDGYSSQPILQRERLTVPEVESATTRFKRTLSPRSTYTEVEFVGIGLAAVGALVALAIFCTWVARWSVMRAGVAKASVTILNRLSTRANEIHKAPLQVGVYQQPLDLLASPSSEHPRSQDRLSLDRQPAAHYSFTHTVISRPPLAHLSYGHRRIHTEERLPDNTLTLAPQTVEHCLESFTAAGAEADTNRSHRSTGSESSQAQRSPTASIYSDTTRRTSQTNFGSEQTHITASTLPPSYRHRPHIDLCQHPVPPLPVFTRKSPPTPNANVPLPAYAPPSSYLGSERDLQNYYATESADTPHRPRRSRPGGPRRLVPKKSMDGGVRLAGGPLDMPRGDGISEESCMIETVPPLPLPSYGVKF
ncbi:hypothetical protein GY45DRAFT_1138883 [Cubamyces sp. BRFM 1775]|nr:hypothetical protein GY45DRAFT_1138883 [Cubamyces sp. BRFM 1775]